jgi:hypothetical protein
MPLTLEDEVLVLCARQEMDGRGIRRLREIASEPGFDWKHLLERSLTHRVGPAVAARISVDEALRSCVPAPVLAEFAHRRGVTRKENILKDAAAIEIAAACTAQGLRPISLKGLSLRTGLYPESWEREGRDLDFLLDRGEMNAFCEVLRELGFEQGLYSAGEHRVVPVVPEQNRLYEEAKGAPCHVWPFFRCAEDLPGYAVAVEPHRSLVPSHYLYTMPTEDIVARAVPRELGGQRLWNPCREHDVLILMIKAFADVTMLEAMKAGFDMRLRSFADIREYWSSGLVDPLAVRDMVRAYGLELPVHYMLRLVEEVYGEPFLSTEVRSLFVSKEWEGSEYWMMDQYNFPGPRPFGIWDMDLAGVFSCRERYARAVDKLFCNSVNRHFSPVRTLRQSGRFLQLVCTE